MKKSSGLGGCVISNNILTGKGDLRWCIKEEPVNDVDTGWRFLSDNDTEEFLSDSSNMSVCDWNTIFEIEPAVMKIYDMPIHTEVTLLKENNRRFFVYTDSEEEVF
ncbi:hypothetical protein CF394_09580 [Tetzosporium hominis]|uniref:Immunity protein Imm33 domain-containing protein n=1 Tax=Tetzosporium hominis TaxID=2020506 RepID=A0A264W2H9_9BACL|nr:DUF2185 domain-containing protein [Tetzosporium hominis]OZS77775.1 hypothetical protein CF394_09580 [Tetzosporium hominis]